MPRELSPLQIELIDRYRQRNPGRMTATTGHDRTPPEPKSVADLDADVSWAKWNAAPAGSLREQILRELHSEPQPAPDSDEIWRQWNAPKQ